MFETLQGKVLQCTAQSIHGVVFYDLVLGCEPPRRLRIQDTFFSPAPVVGETLEVQTIMGNVSEVKRTIP